MFDFDDATAISADGSATVRPGWDIGGNANGGYVLAVLARAMGFAGGRPDPVTINAHYLAPVTVGPVRTETTIVKTGKRFTTVTGSLYQGRREALRATATFGDALADVGAVTYSTLSPLELPAMDECVGRPASNGGIEVGLLHHVDVRLHPDQANILVGPKTGVAEVSGWFAFRDGRPIDGLALLLAADSFPPAVFNLDVPSGWVPTVELTVHLRLRPQPGPLRARFVTHHVADGMFEEDGELWDSADQLVAMSRQLALVAK